MTDHNSGAKEEAEGRGVAGATGANVVPFPRSWYGSPDELVPIDLEPPVTSGRQASVADATAFWGGDATGPRAEAGGISAAPATDDGASFEASGPMDGPAAPPDARGAGAALSRPRSRPRRGWAGLADRRRLRSSPLAVSLIALVAGLAAAIALTSGAPAGHRSSLGADHRRMLTVTQTVPQTTTVVQTVTTRRTPSRRRPENNRVPTKVVRAAERQAAPSIEYHSSTSSVTTSEPSSGSYSPLAGSGSTSSSSSKPGCAPSVTNGGACSL